MNLNNAAKMNNYQETSSVKCLTKWIRFRRVLQLQLTQLNRKRNNSSHWEKDNTRHYVDVAPIPESTSYQKNIAYQMPSNIFIWHWEKGLNKTSTNIFQLRNANDVVYVFSIYLFCFEL